MIDAEFIMKFIKFGAVGASGVGVDFGVTYICKEKFKLNKYLANSTGFIIAASTNYVFNRIWTFHSTDPHIASQYLYFILISVIGLGINNTFLYLFESKAKFNFYLSKLFAIGVTTVWNFFANYFFTFA